MKRTDPDRQESSYNTWSDRNSMINPWEFHVGDANMANLHQIKSCSWHLIHHSLRHIRAWEEPCSTWSGLAFCDNQMLLESPYAQHKCSSYSLLLFPTTLCLCYHYQSHMNNWLACRRILSVAWTFFALLHFISVQRRSEMRLCIFIGDYYLLGFQEDFCTFALAQQSSSGNTAASPPPPLSLQAG